MVPAGFDRMAPRRSRNKLHALRRAAPATRSILQPVITMPQGDKSSYTNKQKRQAAHIEEGYEQRGVSTRTAKARAWATVNKQDGGGKKKH
jgi:hypothetical protein